VWGFGVGAGFARATRFDETRFDETTCFGDFAGFADLLKTSDSQPAWLTSIGRSTDAAENEERHLNRRGQTKIFEKRLHSRTTKTGGAVEPPASY